MGPSDRLIVPSSAWLPPLPAWGAPVTVSGGHAAAHAPEHADVPVLSASNRYKVRAVGPTRALPGIPEMACSDTVVAPTAWLVAAGLLACVAVGAAAGLEVAGLEVAVLEPLEQAATIRPIPATPAALAIQYLMVMLPSREPARVCPGSSAPRRKPQPGSGYRSLLPITHSGPIRFSAA